MSTNNCVELPQASNELQQPKNAPKNFAKDIPEIPDLMVNILQNYSKIEPDKLHSHIKDVRDRAYKIFPYSCVGRYGFLTFPLATHPVYNTFVLPTLQASSSSQNKPLFLDIGTCIGQDLRALLYAGVPSSVVFSTDIAPEFIDAGYDLFQDRERFPAENQLVPVDLFNQGPSKIDSLVGKVSILHMSSIFHMFDLDDQTIVARRVIDILRKPSENSTPSLLLGYQTAHTSGKAISQRPGRRGTSYWLHSKETWENMWTQVAQEKGLTGKLRLNTELATENRRHLQNSDEKEFVGPNPDPEFRYMAFEVWIDP